MPEEPQQSPPSAPPPAPRMRGLFRNTLSLVGAVIIIISLANILFLLLVEAISTRPNPYLGIFAYMVFPGFLMFGILLVPVGIFRERRRRRRTGAFEIPPYPRIDFNNPHHRNVFAFLVSFFVFFLFLSAIGSYRAYEFTDSVEFCGQLCHSVMKPEYTAYKLSPHARVRCVDCHVGTGASWYVKSKMSGLRQVWHTAVGDFPRPIPTPVHDLRPAQDTCEQCHWPQRFYGAQLKVFTHYASDEKNSPLQIRMLIKTGGGSPATGIAAGIHWHMNIANKIEFIASDQHRQVIPYVKLTNPQGQVTIYTTPDSPITPAKAATMSLHRMDCIDCHNRPTHIYVPPDRAVDQSLLAGRLDASMPFIKQQAVAALTGDYKTTPQALDDISKSLTAFYKDKPVPPGDLQEAIKETQHIFSSYFFPEMKVDWRTHPDNVGHLYYPGCFRCHDGNHKSTDGRVIRNDCDTCHTMLGEQNTVERMITTQEVAFKHPVDLGDMKGVSCTDCHTGGVAP